jgi:hypothetical protein
MPRCTGVQHWPIEFEEEYVRKSGFIDEYGFHLVESWRNIVNYLTKAPLNFNLSFKSVGRDRHIAVTVITEKRVARSRDLQLEPR